MPGTMAYGLQNRQHTMKYKAISLRFLPLSDATPDDRSIALLTLERPKKMNAIGPRMALELENVCDELRHLPVRCLIITGAGGNFCAGGDLKVETLSLERPEDRLGLPDNEYADLFLWWLNDHFHLVGQRAFRKVEALQIPVIAAIDGMALGIGFEMSLVCDFRIMTTRARLAEIAIPVGFMSEWSATRTLAQLIGLSRATDLILTGRFVEAEEAQRIGLAHRVVEPDTLQAEALALARRIASLPPLGIRYAKELLRMYQSANQTEAGYAKEMERILEITRSADCIDGVAAFNEKRPPRWRTEGMR
jgi:enoyl-CoA hydratase